ncbi:MAG: Hsp20/alpha crystallin family protein [Desulfuromonadales bacterium]
MMRNLDIFTELDNLRREIDRAFTGMGRTNALEPGFLPGLESGRYPQLNFSEDEQNFYVEALVPGIDTESLDLSVMRGVLSLSGERKAVNGTDKTWHRRERGAGKFMRTVELPAEVDADNVKAEYAKGVLTVTLPKAESAKPKRITIKAS